MHVNSFLLLESAPVVARTHVPAAADNSILRQRKDDSHPPESASSVARTHVPAAADESDSPPVEVSKHVQTNNCMTIIVFHSLPHGKLPSGKEG